MSDMELMEVSTGEMNRMIGDLYAPIEIAPGEVEYVKIIKRSLVHILDINCVKRVRIGVERYDYRDQIAFIEGVRE